MSARVNLKDSLLMSLLLPAVMAGQTLMAQDTLVPAGSAWKYLDDGSNQGTQWCETLFDDSRWPSGRAELGYGDGDEATVVRYGPSSANKFITTYFRHTFSISNPSKYQNLILNVLRDDGAVVYLNGSEVFRTNMPAGTITYATFAVSGLGVPAEQEWHTAIVNPVYLVAGTNLLAVEVHQDRANSSDISFNLSLTGTQGEIPISVRKGPYLIYPGDNKTMTVLWQLDGLESHTLRWGQDANYADGTITPIVYGDFQYAHTITGLTPGTRYYYEVEGVGGGSFLAAPPDDALDVKFLVYGDTRSNPDAHNMVNAAMIDAFAKDPNYQTFAMLTGDWVNNGNNESDWTGQFFSRSQSNTVRIQANLPINGCIGNHEQSGTLYDKYWPYTYEGDGRYWSFDYGPAYVAVIELTSENNGLGLAQRTWLEADLAQSAKDWKFLQFHSPAYSAGGGHANNMIEQAYIQLLCETYGVAIVFAGHNHYYARAMVNGVAHITTGGGGAPLREPEGGYPNVVAHERSYHFCKIGIQGGTLTFEAIRPDGTVIDTFTISRSVEPIVSGLEDFETGDFSKFSWEPSGEESWAVTSQQMNSGTHSAKAGAIEHDQSSTLRVTVDCASGSISFHRKVSSESGFDYLRFYIDGEEQDKWSGEENWAEVSFPVPAGTKTFEWTYSKDGSASEGDDTAWIDDIGFPVAGTPTPPPPSGPIIISVVRANGEWDNRPPIGQYNGNTSVLTTQEGGLRDGNLCYSDRTYPWANTPALLRGAEYIRTFNSDKKSTTVTYTVTISRRATVMVTVDDRIWDKQGAVDTATQRFAPAGTFVDSGLDLYVHQSATTNTSLSVFSARLAAGTYVFSAAASVNTFYVVAAMD